MKAAELHLPGLELATSLLAENPSPGVYAQKLDEALAQAKAATERATRQDAPVDYAQPSEEHPAIDRFAPPKDYVPVAEIPFHPESAVSLKGKLLVALVGAFMSWTWIPRIFSSDITLGEAFLNLLYSAFFVFMFVYSALNAYKDIRNKYAKKSAGAKGSKNVKVLSDTDRAA